MGEFFVGDGTDIMTMWDHFLRRFPREADRQKARQENPGNAPCFLFENSHDDAPVPGSRPFSFHQARVHESMDCYSRSPSQNCLNLDCA